MTRIYPYMRAMTIRENHYAYIAVAAELREKQQERDAAYQQYEMTLQMEFTTRLQTMPLADALEALRAESGDISILHERLEQEAQLAYVVLMTGGTNDEKWERYAHWLKLAHNVGEWMKEHPAPWGI